MKRILAWLHQQSVHRKLLLVIVGTCCASMIVAGTALFIFMNFALRQNFERNAAAQAGVIAANSAGSVAFADAAAALEVLGALRANEQVAGATIRRAGGGQLAATGRADIIRAAKVAPGEGVWFTRDFFVQSAPILLHGENLGTITVVSDFKPMHDQLFKSYLRVFVFVFAGAVLIGVVLTRRAQHVISDPIRRLARAAQAVSQTQNYPVGPPNAAGGEVGQLTDVFHQMVGQIEAGAALAKEVAERRRAEQALRESEERFRSLFENAPIGLYRSSQAGRFLMANPALLNMLGYATLPELMQIDLATEVYVATDYHEHFRDCLEHIGMIEESEIQWRRRDGKIITVRESAKAIRDAAGKVLYFEGCVEDITARQEAQAELQRVNRALVDASRAAGMAEVATGVLHNVGNVLNSVNVSATLLSDELGRSKFATLRQAVALLEENLPRLGAFLTDDAQGRRLPDFLIKVARHVAGEHARWQEELRQLKFNIEHIKEIVAMQQSYARVTGLAEPLAVADLVEDALRMNQAGLDRHHIHIERDFADVPPVMVDKHKVLQILINLIRNAKYALDDGPDPAKRLQLKIYKNGSGRVKIVVQDNGVGIPPENLTRIFSHGFTTRRDGHGFGLHSGALAAKEVGGTLAAASEGPGRGAAFTLELPIAGGAS